MLGITKQQIPSHHPGFQPKHVNLMPIPAFEEKTSYTQMHKTSTHNLLKEI
jgi:hypothetical protein